MRLAPRITAVVAALLLLTPVASAQTATADVPPGVSLRLDVMGPARVTYSGRSVTIDFNPNPLPPPPVPPGPTPVDPPKPVDPPTPVDPPKPAWGPLERIIVLYETTASTGREVLYSEAFQQSITAAATKDAGGWPRWRMWDKDVAAPDATAAAESAQWSAALAAAKAKHGGGVDPVMYGFDPQGRVKVVPLKGMTEAQGVEAIVEMGRIVK